MGVVNLHENYFSIGVYFEDSRLDDAFAIPESIGRLMTDIKSF